MLFPQTVADLRKQAVSSLQYIDSKALGERIQRAIGTVIDKYKPEMSDEDVNNIRTWAKGLSRDDLLQIAATKFTDEQLVHYAFEAFLRSEKPTSHDLFYMFINEGLKLRNTPELDLPPLLAREIRQELVRRNADVQWLDSLMLFDTDRLRLDGLSAHQLQKMKQRVTAEIDDLDSVRQRREKSFSRLTEHIEEQDGTSGALLELLPESFREFLLDTPDLKKKKELLRAIDERLSSAPSGSPRQARMKKLTELANEEREALMNVPQDMAPTVQRMYREAKDAILEEE